MSTATKTKGRRADKPVFMTPGFHRKLIDLAAKMTLFLGAGRTVSPSGAARYAITLLADEAAMWKDFGTADQEYARKRMLEAVKGEG
jgi:hypothetical protein